MVKPKQIKTFTPPLPAKRRFGSSTSMPVITERKGALRSFLASALDGALTELASGELPLSASSANVFGFAGADDVGVVAAMLVKQFVGSPRNPRAVVALDCGGGVLPPLSPVSPE